MFGLEKKYIEFIIDVLNKNLGHSCKYYIFGSRAKGNYKEYSDIDIALDCNGEKISSKILGKIIITFEDSTFPYEVDVVDLNSIDDNFKNIINGSLICINDIRS